MRFWQRFRDVLAEKGMTQTEFADEIGKKQSAVSRWANGTVNPSLENLLLIAEALDMTLSELLEDVDG